MWPWVLRVRASCLVHVAPLGALCPCTLPHRGTCAESHVEDIARCRCNTAALQPAVDVVEHDDPTRSRLECPGCSLDASWQEVPDGEGAPVMCFTCRIVLCGEAAPVVVLVSPCAPPGSQAAAVAEIRQPLAILPGASCSQSAVFWGRRGRLSWDGCVDSRGSMCHIWCPEKDYVMMLSPVVWRES